MARHTTCDGCGKPVDDTSKDQDKQPGRVTVYRGHMLVLVELNDLCNVCTAEVAAFVTKVKERGPARG